MRIEIFYKHGLAGGGAPVGIRQLAAALAKDHEVTLWGKDHGLSFPELEDVDVRAFRHGAELALQLLRNTTAPPPDLVVIVGYFIPENGIVALRARWSRARLVLHPIGQVWDESFQGKIFTHGCDVRRLESKRVNVDGLRERVATWLNPHVKATYKHTIGRALVGSSDLLAVLSDVERAQFQRHYPRPNEDFVLLPWGIDPFEVPPDDGRHFYHDEAAYADGRANFIVWGRLDWHYKGIDRLLYGVLAAKRRLGTLPFRVFLCGPDYRGGSVAASEFIAEHDLTSDVHLLLPGSYEPGSKRPLRDADASILLSRWDGSPRALRESIHLSTPILVSRETNFGTFVNDYGCGLLVERPDDPDHVGDRLIRLSRPEVLTQCTHGTQQLRPKLTWETRGACFIGDVQGRLEQPAAVRNVREVPA